MTKAEFKKEFESLHARYPGFTMPDPKIVMAIYFEDLKWFSLQVFQKAVPEVVARCPQFFPAAGIVRAACELAQAERSQQGKLPNRRFQPQAHKCRFIGQREVFPHSHQMLFELAPYEAFHVTCPGEIHPVCPWCGIVQPVFMNPVVQKLMELYPDETECWNPLHKDTLLCGKCEGLGWPNMNR